MKANIVATCYLLGSLFAIGTLVQRFMVEVVE